MRFVKKIKKLLTGSITCVLLSVIFLSSSTVSAATYLQVYPQCYPETTFKLTCEATTKNIYFNVDDAWSASTDVKWIVLNKTSGSGTNYITATIAGNYSGTKRTGNITITSGALSHTVPVEQGADAAYLNIGYYETSTCSAWGANLYIGVSSNTYWYATDDVDYVSFGSGTSGYGNGTCQAFIPQNNTGSTRTIHFTFTAGTITKTITVIQPST